MLYRMSNSRSLENYYWPALSTALQRCGMREILNFFGLSRDTTERSWAAIYLRMKLRLQLPGLIERLKFGANNRFSWLIVCVTFSRTAVSQVLLYYFLLQTIEVVPNKVLFASGLFSWRFSNTWWGDNTLRTNNTNTHLLFLNNNSKKKNQWLIIILINNK